MKFEEALELATRKHAGQYRDDNTEFISHPIAVAKCFSDELYKIVAVLHDTIEDTDLTIDELSNKYFLCDDAIKALELLTKDKNETYINYIIGIKENEIATAVKRMDLYHNLSNLPPHCNRCRKDKYLMALYILDRT